jgi:hypothetical protein
VEEEDLVAVVHPAWRMEVTSYSGYGEMQVHIRKILDSFKKEVSALGKKESRRKSE